MMRFLAWEICVVVILTLGYSSDIREPSEPKQSQTNDAPVTAEWPENLQASLSSVADATSAGRPHEALELLIQMLVDRGELKTQQDVLKFLSEMKKRHR